MIVVLIQILLLSMIFFSLWKRKSGLFISVITIQILLYDVFSVCSDEFLPIWLRWTMKGWQELIFLFSCFFFIREKKKMPSEFWVFLILGLIGLICGVINSNPADQIIQGFRLYLLLPFALIILLKTGIFEKFNVLIPAYILLAFCFLSVLYSLWLDSQFQGDLQQLWFYDFVDKRHPVEAARFNYIRDGGLRASGFFISPLVQSAALGFAALLCFRIFVQNWPANARQLLLGLILIIFILGLYYCRTRIGWVIFGGGLFQWFGPKYLNKNRPFSPFLVPGALILITFLWLLSGFSTEPSANGRLDQYAFFLREFSFWGFGFGHPLTMTLFDSLVISSALLFGIFSILYLLIPVSICLNLGKILASNLPSKDSGSDFFLIQPVSAFSSMLLYSMVFQFTNGGPVIALFYWFAFLLFSNKNHQTKSA